LPRERRNRRLQKCKHVPAKNTDGGVGGQKVQLQARLVFIPHIILIEKHDDVSGSKPHAAVARRGDAGVGLVHIARGRPTPNLGSRCVRRAIVDHDEFDAVGAKRLRQNAVDCRADVSLAVVGGNDDRDAGGCKRWRHDEARRMLRMRFRYLGVLAASAWRSLVILPA
jgi:hypothetical protein